MHLPPGLLESLRQGLEKIVAIDVSYEDRFLPISSAHHRIDSPGYCTRVLRGMVEAGHPSSS